MSFEVVQRDRSVLLELFCSEIWNYFTVESGVPVGQ
jgi:hypothetical protein